MIGFTITDRSTICVLEDKIISAAEEFMNADSTDRWMVEDLISKYARKETVTKEDITLGYVLLSFPERTLEVSLASNEDKEISENLRGIASKNGFKFES